MNAIQKVLKEGLKKKQEPRKVEELPENICPWCGEEELNKDGMCPGCDMK